LEHDSWANIDEFVHETKAQNLDVIIAVLESSNYSIYNCDLIKLELLGDVFKKTESRLPDISSIINCVFEGSKIYDADEILFNWRL